MVFSIPSCSQPFSHWESRISDRIRNEARRCWLWRSSEGLYSPQPWDAFLTSPTFRRRSSCRCSAMPMSCILRSQVTNHPAFCKSKLLPLISSSVRVSAVSIFEFAVAASHSSGGQTVTYTGMRRTAGRSNVEELLWVYRRRARPCRRCGTAIALRKQVPAPGQLFGVRNVSRWSWRRHSETLPLAKYPRRRFCRRRRTSDA